MPTVIIFWLNPKTNFIYHRIYKTALFYEVGQENNYGHILLAIGRIENKKLVLFNNWQEFIILPGKKEMFKTKSINFLIDKLEKMKKKGKW